MTVLESSSEEVESNKSSPELSTRLSTVLPCPSLPMPSNMASLPLLTRSQIASRIAAGHLLVIHYPLVYRIPRAWLDTHPGGQLAILHYIGRDATNEIEAYHTGKTVQERMGRWVIGKVSSGYRDVQPGVQDMDKVGMDEETEHFWRDMVPPIQLGMWPIPVPKIYITSPIESLADQPPPDSDASASDSDPSSRTASSSTKLIGKISLTMEMVDPPLAASDLLPLTPSYQGHLRRSHRKLQKSIQDLGLDTPPPFLCGYGPSLVIYISLALLFVYVYSQAKSTLGYVLAAVVLGAFWHQITFVAHDAGHTGLTGDWLTDRVLGILIGDFLGGISLGWWANNHNIHHVVTNSPEHDPDIQHLPFFAISTKFLDSLTSSYYNRVMEFDWFAKYTLPYQHNLYYIIMCFARVNLFVLSYQFLLTNSPSRSSPLFKLRLFELAGIVFFWMWFGGIVVRGIEGTGNKILFVLVSFAVTSPLHVQIVLSHFSQPVSISSCIVPHTELLESHLHRQLRTTMDISCPPCYDFLHGGLNFQTPHHLLPRIPRFRFREVMGEVERWVQREQELVTVEGKEGKWWKGDELKPNEGLVYKKMKFVEANKSVLGTLKGVADQVKLLAEVAKAEAKGELHHH